MDRRLYIRVCLPASGLSSFSSASLEIPESPDLLASFAVLDRILAEPINSDASSLPSEQPPPTVPLPEASAFARSTSPPSSPSFWHAASPSALQEVKQEDNDFERLEQMELQSILEHEQKEMQEQLQKRQRVANARHGPPHPPRKEPPIHLLAAKQTLRAERERQADTSQPPPPPSLQTTTPLLPIPPPPTAVKQEEQTQQAATRPPPPPATRATYSSRQPAALSSATPPPPPPTGATVPPLPPLPPPSSSSAAFVVPPIPSLIDPQQIGEGSQQEQQQNP